MRHLIYISVFLTSLITVYPQKVEVTATTDKKKVDAILKNVNEKGRINRAFFDEHDKCRSLMRTREWVMAESSCRLAILRVEKLPKEHILERSSVRVSLALTLLWLRKTEEVISLLNKALEIRKQLENDAGVEFGEIYFLVAQAYHDKRDVAKAAEFYDKAEMTVRAAFIDMGDDVLRERYPKLIQNILTAHIILLEDNELQERAEVARRRETDFEKEFVKHL